MHGPSSALLCMLDFRAPPLCHNVRCRRCQQVARPCIPMHSSLCLSHTPLTHPGCCPAGVPNDSVELVADPTIIDLAALAEASKAQGVKLDWWAIALIAVGGLLLACIPRRCWEGARCRGGLGCLHSAGCVAGISVGCYCCRGTVCSCMLLGMVCARASQLLPRSALLYITACALLSMLLGCFPSHCPLQALLHCMINNSQWSPACCLQFMS